MSPHAVVSDGRARRRGTPATALSRPFLAGAALVALAFVPGRVDAGGRDPGIGGTARAAADTVLVELLDDHVVEGNAGRRALQFRVSLSRPLTQPVTMDYQTTDGSARAADGDYLPIAGTLVIQPVAPAFSQRWGSAGVSNGSFHFPYALAVDAVGNVFVADRDNFRIQKFTSDGVHLATWGSRGTGPGQFRQPQGITIDGSGNVYVADAGNDRIQKFTNDGVFLASWGSSGFGGGEFRLPCGVSADRDGAVYVADSGNDRVQKFTESGVYLGEWGIEGACPSCFSFPQGIAADGNGHVYVLDSGNHRVQRFGPDGAYLGQWGRRGTAPGQLKFPYGIAVGADGTVFVTDSYNHRLQSFTGDGAFIGAWGGYGAADGQMKYPNGIALDGQGRAFVADSHNHRVQRFAQASSSATLVVEIEGDAVHEPDEWVNLTLSNPVGAVLTRATAAGAIEDDDGNGAVILSVADATTVEGDVGAIPLAFTVRASRPLDAPVSVDYGTLDGSASVSGNDFTPVSGTLVLPAPGPVFGREWGTQGSERAQFNAPAGVVMDAVGTIYVLDSSNHRVQRFDTSFAFLDEWGGYGPGPGQFAFPRGIAWGGGNICVADTRNDRVQKFSTTGALLASWGTEGSGDGQFNDPQGVAVAPDGTVYVADTGNNRIQWFTPQGVFIGKSGMGGVSDGRFSAPSGVAVDATGLVYVVDTSNQRVQKLTAAGVFVSKWGTLGGGDGQFLYPHGIAVSPMGKVYVVDTYNHRVQEFTAAGAFIRRWGASGTGPAQFNLPEGLAADAAGTVFIADRFNHRIQRMQAPLSSAVVTVPILGDDQLEDEEILRFVISHPVGAVIPDAEALGYIRNDDGATGVAPGAPSAPLLQIVGAHPARGPLRLRFGIPERAHVVIAVYDIAGREVARLVDGLVEPGAFETTWSETTSRRQRRAGIYLVRMSVGGRSLTRRVAVLD